MKVEGGTLQMASTLTSVNNFMELIQGQLIMWRSLALVVTTLVLDLSQCLFSNNVLLVDAKKITTHHGETRLEGP